MDRHDEPPGGLAEYVNVPRAIGAAISGNLALLGPLSTTLGLEDLYDILEVKQVDGHNARVWREWRDREDR